MRIIVLFDLPTITYQDQKAYRSFRNLLLKEGFLMMQESIYTKLALNRSIANSAVTKIKNNRPKKGLIEILTITEKQFSSIEYIVGEKETNVEDTETRLLIL